MPKIHVLSDTRARRRASKGFALATIIVTAIIVLGAASLGSLGDHSVRALTDAKRRTPDMPLYTLRNKQAPGEIIQTTDPGRALVTGKWKDIGRFKGPILRGLAARAPYFHNGFAKDLDAAVDFYNERFGLGLTDAEHDDLVAFLLTL